MPQAFSHALLNIPDVDSAHAGASLLCNDYVKDIYAHLRNLEVFKLDSSQLLFVLSIIQFHVIFIYLGCQEAATPVNLLCLATDPSLNV